MDGAAAGSDPADRRARRARADARRRRALHRRLPPGRRRPAPALLAISPYGKDIQSLGHPPHARDRARCGTAGDRGGRPCVPDRERLRPRDPRPARDRPLGGRVPRLAVGAGGARTATTSSSGSRSSPGATATSAWSASATSARSSRWSRRSSRRTSRRSCRGTRRRTSTASPPTTAASSRPSSSCSTRRIDPRNHGLGHRRGVLAGGARAADRGAQGRPRPARCTRALQRGRQPRSRLPGFFDVLHAPARRPVLLGALGRPRATTGSRALLRALALVGLRAHAPAGTFGTTRASTRPQKLRIGPHGRRGAAAPARATTRRSCAGTTAG